MKTVSPMVLNELLSNRRVIPHSTVRIAGEPQTAGMRLDSFAADHQPFQPVLLSASCFEKSSGQSLGSAKDGRKVLIINQYTSSYLNRAHSVEPC
jgi:hypothetical protein